MPLVGLFFAHSIGLDRRSDIGFHPTCAKDTHQASDNERWYAGNQHSQAQISTCHVIGKMPSVRWIKVFG
jgi:hypothetical protein